MDKLQLLKFIDSPSSINKVALPKIIDSIKKYPYCQSMQVLLARHLYDVKSSHFENQLSKASVYAGNREHLYNLIYKPDAEADEEVSKGVAANPAAKDIKPSLTKTIKKEDETKAVSSEPAKEQVPKKITEEKKAAPLETKPTEPVAKKKEEGSLDAEEKKKKLQEQIKQRLAEISNKKTGDNPEEKKKPEQPISSSNEIIDRFIDKEPRIVRKPENEIPEGDLSIEGSENENFISETLAHIYYKQGKLEKAIETYEKLILKFPEKSTYFANQIEQIKQSLK